MKGIPIVIRLLALLGLSSALASDATSPPFHCETTCAPMADVLGSWARRRAHPASDWTEGRKRLLLVRVDFSDLTGAPFSAVQGTNLLTELDRFYSEMSFGKTGFFPPGQGSDFTPVFRMPLTAAAYGALNPSRLRTDALNVARNNGYDAQRYDLDVLCSGNISGYKFSGFAYVGIRGAWLKNAFASVGPLAHELGHNFGLNHANLWDTAGLGIIGPGKEAEYGDTSDTMSLSTGSSRHFNARTKHLLHWLSDSDIAFPTTSGVHRLHAHDLTNATAGPRALRIARNARTHYWLEFRQLHTNAPIASSSLGIRWADHTNRATLFLDTTPATAPGARDGFLRPGHTFSDPTLDLHITTLGRTNTTPPAIDVDLQFGPFPGNRPPVASMTPAAGQLAIGSTATFVVTASDPDGDALAYGWDLGDESTPANEPTLTRTFETPGDQIVQCIVSDRRGLTTTVKAVVRVGEASGWKVSGTVRRAGVPLDGATLLAGTHRIARTDHDGQYLFAGLTNGLQTLRPHLDGYAFVPARTNLLVSSADLADVDFTAYALENLQSVDLSPAGVSWRYLDDGSNPSLNWRTNGFSDSAWKSGAAPLGYGMTDLTTQVSFGPNPAGKWVTTYFRRIFTATTPTEWLALRVHLQRDDGAVVYLNGLEVARSNLKDGDFNFLTFALEDVIAPDDRQFVSSLIDPALLRPGDNQLAVEVHQFINTSPDCRFDLRLEGLRVPVSPPAEAAEIHIVSDVGPLSLYILGTPGGRYRIEYTDAFEGWMPEIELIFPASGTVTWHLPTPLAEARFFRVLVAP